jgi:hypothetical protein
MDNFGTCRNCGHKILWMKTKDGANRPCDPEPVTVDALKMNDTVISESGFYFRGTTQIPKNTRQRFYYNHFDTCVNNLQYQRRT